MLGDTINLLRFGVAQKRAENAAKKSHACCGIDTRGNDHAQLVVVMIGASSGIGYHAAHQLRNNHACSLLLTAPSEDERAACDFHHHEDNDDVHIQTAVLDLASPSSINSFVHSFFSWLQACNVLVLNAALVPPSGRERVFATDWCTYRCIDTELSAAVNVIGPLALLQQALPLMHQLQRVVHTSSFVHRVASASGAQAVSSGCSASKPFCALRAYAESKLALLAALVAMLQDSDKPALCVLDPNIVGTKLNTDVMSSAFGTSRARKLEPQLMRKGQARSPEVAAECLVHLVLCSDSNAHSYVFLSGHSASSLVQLMPAKHATVSLGQSVIQRACRSS